MPRIVNVTYHQEPEGLWAESIDAPGFFATGSSRSELRRRVYEFLPQVLGVALDEIEMREAEICLGAAMVPVEPPKQWSTLPEGFALSWSAGQAPEAA
jgi:predicted RNase H-like HicB family nuclease